MFCFSLVPINVVLKKYWLSTAVVLLVFLFTACADTKQEQAVVEVEKPSVEFNYSVAETLMSYFFDGNLADSDLTTHEGYQLVFDHSKKFSSRPITKDDLIKALHGEITAFNFTNLSTRTTTLKSTIQYLKDNEEEILNEYANQPLKYLPKDYSPNATLFYVIGGYNGIAMDNKICVNIDHEPFRKNNNEIKLYIAHELFHLGFEKYHTLPDIFAAKTVKDLKEIVLGMTMNEGLATLTPFQKRIETNELDDYDYQILLDSAKLNQKLLQFDNVMKFLDSNLDEPVTNEILGQVLGQCSGDRLFYIVGCHIGLTIEKEYGASKIIELVKEKPEEFFKTYNGIIASKNQ